MKTNKTISLVAGKSAGHILPALTVAQKLKTLDPDLNVIFFSNQNQLDQTILNNHKLVNINISLPLMALPYKQIYKLPKFAWQLLRAMWRSYQILKKHQPSQIISTGGLIAIPVCLVAKHLNIPVTIYELNVYPGKATKFLVTVANNVKICFAKTAQYLPKTKCELVSYPIRFEPQDYSLTKNQALELIKPNSQNFTLSNKTILILGGSQGSLFINDLIRQFILKQPNISLQTIHQTGTQDQFDWNSFYQSQNIPAIVFSYESDLMKYYTLADLIICRSGAGTLAEIIPLKTACITIPLATGYTAHQIDNALATAQDHPQICVLQQNQIAQDFNLFYDLVNLLLN